MVYISLDVCVCVFASAGGGASQRDVLCWVNQASRLVPRLSYLSNYLCIDCPFGLVGVGQALHFLETHCSPCTHAPKHLSC